MKKLFTLILSIMLCFLFAFTITSCGVNDNKNNIPLEDSEHTSVNTENTNLSSEENTINHVDQPMYYWFYTADEFQTWVNNGGDNYSGSQYVLNVIKEEGEVILPFLKNSKYNFIGGEINFNAEESKILLTLTFECKNTEKYTEKYQAVNVLYMYISVVNENDRNLDSKNYFISKYSKKRNYDEWFSTSSKTINGGTFDYIYHDCDPSEDSEDRTSYAHILIDKKWVLTIYQQNGLQMKPFDHEILNWLDFETITYNR
jgi:hypothetical protein